MWGCDSRQKGCRPLAAPGRRLPPCEPLSLSRPPTALSSCKQQSSYLRIAQASTRRSLCRGPRGPVRWHFGRVSGLYPEEQPAVLPGCPEEGKPPEVPRPCVLHVPLVQVGPGQNQAGTGTHSAGRQEACPRGLASWGPGGCPTGSHWGCHELCLEPRSPSVAVSWEWLCWGFRLPKLTRDASASPSRGKKEACSLDPPRPSVLT